jgi:hypothetical protein
MKKAIYTLVILVSLLAMFTGVVSAYSADQPKSEWLADDSASVGCFKATFTFRGGVVDHQSECFDEKAFGLFKETPHVHTQFIITQSVDLTLSARHGWHWEFRTESLFEKAGWFLIKDLQ